MACGILCRFVGSLSLLPLITASDVVASDLGRNDS